jgi:hypothetical protein
MSTTKEVLTALANNPSIGRFLGASVMTVGGVFAATLLSSSIEKAAETTATGLITGLREVGTSPGSGAWHLEKGSEKIAEAVKDLTKDLTKGPLELSGR